MAMATFTPTKQQQDIIALFEAKYGPEQRDKLVSLFVNAVAGAGKTSSLMLVAEAVKRLNLNITGCMVSFNKIIATAAQDKLDKMGSGLKSKTTNALGHGILADAARNGLCPKINLESKKYHDLASNFVFARKYSFHAGKIPAKLISSINKLVSATRLTFTEPTEDKLLDIVEHYGLEIPMMHWGFICSAVAPIIEEGVNEFLATGKIDFDDQIYLPLRLEYAAPTYDLLMVDEAQDLNSVRLKLIQACIKPNGMLLFVGDKHQCQPAGTMVKLADGSECAIENLRVGNKVVTYSRDSAVFVKNGLITKRASRHYDGLLYTIKAGGKQSRCTDSHKWLVRWTDGEDAFVTYLMKKGDSYRIGQTKMFINKGNTKGYGNFDFGLAGRARSEKAEAGWVLKVHKTREEALVYEQILSATYGIPELCFNAHNLTVFTQDMIDKVFSLLPDQTARAKRCLGDHGRKIEHPFYSFQNGLDTSRQRQGRSTLFEIQACNLIPEYMAIPVVQDELNYMDRIAHWASIEVTMEPYSGVVYSLNVENHHKYVADGLLTCNSIQGFAFADTDSVNTIKRTTGATELPLSVCWRCDAKIIEVTQEIVPHIEGRPGAPDGIVDLISSAMLTKELATGYKRGSNKKDPDLCLCRVNAELISYCLECIRVGKYAVIRGRSIGRGILAKIDEIIEKANCTVSVQNLSEEADTWLQKQIKALWGKKNAEEKIAKLEDQINSIDAFLTGFLIDHPKGNIDQLRVYIEEKFSGDEGDSTEEKDGTLPIIFSTVHKAKGLEFDRVFIIRPDLMPHPMAKLGWQVEQEYNILYVACTRAKHELYFVDSVPDCLKHVVLPEEYLDEKLDEQEAVAIAESIVAPIIETLTSAVVVDVLPESEQETVSTLNEPPINSLPKRSSIKTGRGHTSDWQKFGCKLSPDVITKLNALAAGNPDLNKSAFIDGLLAQWFEEHGL